MKFIRKEIIEFNEKERNAIYLMIEICTELMREATDPKLEELAEKTFDCVTTLLGWEE